jgi:hypothetical protein
MIQSYFLLDAARFSVVPPNRIIIKSKSIARKTIIARREPQTGVKMESLTHTNSEL